jgi:hypothetical protein
MLVNLQKIPGNQYGIVIADILDQWLMQPSAVPSPTSCQNTKLHYANFPIEYVGAILRAIKDQSAIGWLNMVRGFFAQSWCVLASTYNYILPFLSIIPWRWPTPHLKNASHHPPVYWRGLGVLGMLYFMIQPKPTCKDAKQLLTSRDCK